MKWNAMWPWHILIYRILLFFMTFFRKRTVLQFAYDPAIDGCAILYLFSGYIMNVYINRCYIYICVWIVTAKCMQRHENSKFLVIFSFSVYISAYTVMRDFVKFTGHQWLYFLKKIWFNGHKSYLHTNLNK